MKTKISSLFLGLFFVVNVFSQKNINNYKYVIVPQKFDFLKKKDQYQLNSLSVFLFNKYGFQAIMEGSEYPEDLSKSRCLALDFDVIKGSGVFKTKLNIVLKDCNGQVVYTSKLGESIQKEYSKAYTEALRNAFNYLKTLNYKYKPKEGTSSSVNFKQTPTKKAVKPIVNEVVDVKKDLSSTVLYAQEIENGFQLVDSSPKVVFILKNTGLDNVFLVKGKTAIVYKKGEHWFIEYYFGRILKQDKLNIKF